MQCRKERKDLFAALYLCVLCVYKMDEYGDTKGIPKNKVLVIFLLHNKDFLFEIIHYNFEIIDSTNNWAKRKIEDFNLNALTVVTAEEQTAGRGQFEHSWMSPKGNLYQTYCFFLNQYSNSLGVIPQIMALSVTRLLKTLGFRAEIKWPNDVLVNDKKICGILCETSQVQTKLAVFLGIGLNINMSSQYLSQIDQPATSMYLESQQQYSLIELAKDLEAIFCDLLAIFLKDDFAPFLEEYHLRMKYLGEHVQLLTQQREVRGKVLGIKENGSLILELSNGTRQEFMSGRINPLN